MLSDKQLRRAYDNGFCAIARPESAMAESHADGLRAVDAAVRADMQPREVEVTDDRMQCDLDADGRMVAKPHDPCPIKVRTKAGNWVTTLPMSALGFHMPHEVQEFAPSAEFCQRPSHYFAALGGGDQ